MRLRADFKSLRQREAQERFELSQGMGPIERLKALDERLGANTGAKKERARLHKALLNSLPELPSSGLATSGLEKKSKKG